MGYIRHNAIVVTSYKDEYMQAAKEKAESFGLQVIGPGSEVVNGYQTLLICPDGSKEGWETSTDCDAARDAFRKWLHNERHGDGSSWYEWVEVAYGNDDHKAVIEQSARQG